MTDKELADQLNDKVARIKELEREVRALVGEKLGPLGEYEVNGAIWQPICSICGGPVWYKDLRRGWFGCTVEHLAEAVHRDD